MQRFSSSFTPDDVYRQLRHQQEQKKEENKGIFTIKSVNLPPDRVVWHYDNKSIFIVKNAYRLTFGTVASNPLHPLVLVLWMTI